MFITMYISFNFIRLINSMTCIPEHNLATLHGFNTFLLKIFRAQMVFTAKNIFHNIIIIINYVLIEIIILLYET
jgi:hypothetical protein